MTFSGLRSAEGAKKIRYLRKMDVFEELSEIAKKSWLFQVFKVFSWLVFAFPDFFQVLQVFQDYQVFQVSGHHECVKNFYMKPRYACKNESELIYVYNYLLYFHLCKF